MTDGQDPGSRPSEAADEGDVADRGVASYIERAPVQGLSRMVRTVWIHRTGDAPYLQRHLPTGGMELHWPIGGEPRLLGPLTSALVEVIPARTTLVGVRFWPGQQLSLPMSLDELHDELVTVRDLGLDWIARTGDAMASAPSADAASMELQSRLLTILTSGTRSDGLVAEAVQRLMPWRRVEIATLAGDLGLSESQLRRRFLHSVGMSPKSLQLALRFQGFLALAQAGSGPSRRRGTESMAALAAEVGYADQSHLTRECVRLTGVTPRALLGSDLARCVCGHEHAASYRPFLATRGRDEGSARCAAGDRKQDRAGRADAW